MKVIITGHFVNRFNLRMKTDDMQMCQEDELVFLHKCDCKDASILWEMKTDAMKCHTCDTYITPICDDPECDMGCKSRREKANCLKDTVANCVCDICWSENNGE